MAAVDVEVLDDGQGVRATMDGLRFEAIQIRSVEGVVRAVVTVSEGSRIWHRDGPLSLTSARNRAQYLAQLAAARHNRALTDGLDPLLVLEEAIRHFGIGQRPDPSGLSGSPFEHSNTCPEVEHTPELAALLTDSHLFGRLSNTIKRQGWVGNRRPPLMAYLALTSRLLSRPINLAFIAPAATGKNRAIDSACALLPPEAFYLERSGSERALIYCPEDFRHRVVIFAEADSIPDDGPVASAIRSLASDNVLAYDTVEQNPTTNRFETRRIEKPGPTGLITTSTKSLQHQLGTRLLEVAVPDDKHQTRQVMLGQARGVDDSPTAPCDLAVWINLQRWMAATAPSQIVVPFANILAAKVPADAVRMRRDFPQLLSCIQALALLHQQRRPRTAEGAIVATLADYRIARALLAPIFNALTSHGLTPTIRATVEAVPLDEEISQADLAKRLNVEKSTVSWRVGRALKGSWLKNLEPHRGRPARLVRGDALPDPATALPSVHVVREVFDDRSIGVRTETSGVTDTSDESSAEVFECLNQFREGPSSSATEARSSATEAPMDQEPPLTFVTVKGGLTLPLPAINLAVDLEFRGIVLTVDEAHELLVPDDSRLTAADRAAIHRWRRHLIAILLTPCPAVGVSQ